jgi:hypothetical protein
MCETCSQAVGRPRWGWLYGATLAPLAALAMVEAATPPSVLRAVLRYALALGAMAGMALWVRANRVAFDLQNWCDRAGATITVRVIESRPPPVADHPDPCEPVPAWADAELELARR